MADVQMEEANDRGRDQRMETDVIEKEVTNAQMGQGKDRDRDTGLVAKKKNQMRRWWKKTPRKHLQLK